MKISFLLLLTLVSNIVFANKGHEILSNASPETQKRVLSQLMNKSGKPCSVNVVFFQGFDRDNTAYWNVSCASGSSFAIAIKNDNQGSTRILNCKILKSMGTSCFTKL